MALVETIIDGQEIEVERDRWALGVARGMGIKIPTLCHHPALEPYGACRLCVVQVTKGRWTWLTTSCDLPIREGLTIRTDTPEVLKARKMALELLWAEAPAAEEVAHLAREMGVQQPRFSSSRKMNRCILCGLCVKVCENLIGAGAIGFSQRGASRWVGAPFHESSDACIGCEACAVVCPTGHVRSADVKGRRQMRTWNTELELAACEACGTPFAPVKQLEYVRAKLPQHLSVGQICPACRRFRTVARMSATPAGADK